MIVCAIAAVAENRVIGKDNDLIWNLPDDMKFFKEKTLNTVVIMGRKNFESIPHKYRPLPNRINIVLSRNKNYSSEGIVVFESIESAIEYCKCEHFETVFVIGGGEIYKLALEKDLVDEMYITQVHDSFEGDSFFPIVDDKQWAKSILAEHAIDDLHDHSFTMEHWVKNK